MIVNGYLILLTNKSNVYNLTSNPKEIKLEAILHSLASFWMEFGASMIECVVF